MAVGNGFKRGGFHWKPGQQPIHESDRTGEGLVVRLYNPLSEEVGGEISLGVAFEQAYMANLLEEYLAPLEVHNGMIPVRVCAGGILTVICV